jgi:DNA-binding NarL/FixJ family response regulator
VNVLRVVIADDQGMVRAGLRSLLSAEPDIDVVGEAADGERAVALVRASDPDVALIDVRMPVLDGIAATTRIVAAAPRTRVLVLTTFDLDEYLFRALRAGACGFLLKDAPAEDLAAAIRLVAAGEGILAPAVTGRVIQAFARTSSPDPRYAAALDLLTTREREVLRLVARGLTNAEIASRLHVTDATAKTHVSNLLTKLGARDRIQAVIAAYEAGLVVPGTA